MITAHIGDLITRKFLSSNTVSLPRHGVLCCTVCNATYHDGFPCSHDLFFVTGEGDRCQREHGHTGPCSGYPNVGCPCVSRPEPVIKVDKTRLGQAEHTTLEVKIDALMPDVIEVAQAILSELASARVRQQLEDANRQIVDLRSALKGSQESLRILNQRLDVEIDLHKKTKAEMAALQSTFYEQTDTLMNKLGAVRKEADGYLDQLKKYDRIKAVIESLKTVQTTVTEHLLFLDSPRTMVSLAEGIRTKRFWRVCFGGYNATECDSHAEAQKNASTLRFFISRLLKEFGA